VPPTERRAFNFLFAELSVAVGELIPRYALWLRMQELGADPSFLARQDLLAFHDHHLEAFLASCGLLIRERSARRLRRVLDRFDPRRPTPEEVMERIFSTASSY